MRGLSQVGSIVVAARVASFAVAARGTEKVFAKGGEDVRDRDLGAFETNSVCSLLRENAHETKR